MGSDILNAVGGGGGGLVLETDSPGYELTFPVDDFSLFMRA